MNRIRKSYKINSWFPVLLGIFLLLWLIGCQPETSPVIVTRSTLQATGMPSLTPVPSPTATIELPTPMETATTAVTTTPPTIEPTFTSVPPSPTSAAWQINDRSSFLIRQEGYDIYLLRPGQTSNHISTGRLLEGQPWSPDGTKIIYDDSASFQPDPPPELSVADLITGQTTILNLLSKPRTIFWSPDGNYLLYGHSKKDSTTQIVLYDFLNEENSIILEVVREDDWYLFLAGWSPDSQKIAFVTGMNNQVDLFVMEVESREVRQLTDTPEYETIAVWSPTENRLIFGTLPNSEHALEVWPWGARSLYLIDDSGEDLLWLSDSIYYSASWSSNGEQIAYSDGGQICIWDIQFQEEVCPLKDVVPYDGYFASIGDAPIWSKDGKWIAFQATGHMEGQCYRVYIWELSTKLVTPVDRGTCGVDPFYWSVK